jgi:hypothetical protein
MKMKFKLQIRGKDLSDLSSEQMLDLFWVETARARILFGMPDDLYSVNFMVDEMLAVLSIHQPVSDPNESDSLNEVIKGLQIIQNNKNWIEENYPLSCVKNSTLHGYYGKYPHYCVYFHSPKNDQISAPWRCIVATFLPLLVELEIKRNKKNPNSQPKLDIKYDDRKKYFSYRQEKLCRGIRQVSLPSRSSNFEIIKRLPLTAVTLKRWLKEFDLVCKDLGLSFSQEFAAEPFPLIKSVLVEKLNDWPYIFKHSGGRKDGAIGKKNIQVVQDGAKSSKFVENTVDESGDKHTIRHYVSRDIDDDIRDESIDPYLKSDRLRVESSMTLDSDRSLDYYLTQRNISISQNSKFMAQAIERENQKLPISAATLTGKEIGLFLNAIQDIKSQYWEDIPVNRRAEVSVWCALRFFLSREPGDLVAYCFQKGARKPALSSVHILNNYITLNAGTPSHKAPADKGQTVKVVSYLRLRMPSLLVSLIQKLDNSKSKLFHSDHEGEFKSLLFEINKRHFTELSAHKIGLAMSSYISQIAPVDQVMGTYFKGQSPDSHIPSIYSALPVLIIQLAFNQACVHFQEISDVEILNRAEANLSVMDANIDEHVGSLHVPTINHMKETVHQLHALLHQCRQPGASFLQIHNIFTAYCVFYYQATCGARTMGNIFPSLTDIDWETGVAYMSSKDTDQYQHSNLIWLHPQLLDQFKKYRAHVQHMRQFLAPQNVQTVQALDRVVSTPEFTSGFKVSRKADLALLADRAPLFFFLEPGTFRRYPVSPTLLAQYLGAEWNLRAVSLRHFVRTQLMEHCLGGEAIGALLGHADRGQSPWASLSSMPPSVWRKELGEAMESVMKRIDLEPITSPLIRTAE